MPEGVSKRPVVLGISLIIIGLLFIADRADIINFSWPFFLIAIGIAILSGVALEKRHDAIFPGVLLTLLGISFLIMEFNWLRGGYGDGWPIIVITVGLSFLITYFVHPEHSSGALIPGGIVTGVGLLFLLANYRIIRWRGLQEVFEWWPVLLIIIGLWLLLRRKS